MERCGPDVLARGHSHTAMQGFPHLQALWGDTILPPPPPHPFFCVPFWPPWAGPVVDIQQAEARRLTELRRQGLPLPAHEYGEDSSPDSSLYWPPPIKQLHYEASQEESDLKYSFRLRYPFHPVLHPERAAETPAFLRARRHLHVQLGMLLTEVCRIL